MQDGCDLATWIADGAILVASADRAVSYSSDGKILTVSGGRCMRESGIE